MPILLADNTMGTFQTYVGRKAFREKIYQANDNVFLGDTPLNPEVKTEYLIDLLYEYPYYGKMDTLFNPVYARESNVRNFNYSPDNISALDFVVEAFEQLREHMIQANNMRKIDLRNSPLGSFKAVKAFQDPVQDYIAHLESYIGGFATDFLPYRGYDRNIFSFSDFIKYFNLYLTENLRKFPITMTGFMKSIYANGYTSGLFIDISRDLESEDEGKLKWIRDPNYSFYVSAAKKFGFYVDKNCPWRLVCDISAKETFSYLSPMGITNTKEIFDSYYTRTFRNDIYYLKSSLYDMYNEYVTEFPNVITSHLEGCVSEHLRPSIEHQNYFAKTTIKARSYIEADVYLERYTDLFWLVYYYNIRLQEARLNWNSQKTRKYKNHIINYYKKTLNIREGNADEAYSKTLELLDDLIVMNTPRK